MQWNTVRRKVAQLWLMELADALGVSGGHFDKGTFECRKAMYVLHIETDLSIKEIGLLCDMRENDALLEIAAVGKAISLNRDFWLSDIAPLLDRLRDFSLRLFDSARLREGAPS